MERKKKNGTSCVGACNKHHIGMSESSCAWDCQHLYFLLLVEAVVKAPSKSFDKSKNSFNDISWLMTNSIA